MTTTTFGQPSATAPALSSTLALRRDGIAAYLALGIPGLFGVGVAQGDSAAIDTGETVLYLPPRVLEEIESTAVREHQLQTGLGSQPLLIEGHQLFPLLWRGELLAMLVPEDASATIKTTQFKPLLAELAALRLAENAEIDQGWEQFVVDSLRTDQSFEQFLKTVLGYWIDCWDGSYAGFYLESLGTYNLRLSTGSVVRCHALPYEWSAADTARVLAAMQNKVRFLPVESVLESPQFLPGVPDMVFVHPGLRTGAGSQVLAAAGPGDLNRVSACTLIRIAGTVCQMEVSRFTAMGDLGLLYNRLASSAKADIHRCLCEAATTIGRTGAITRLALACGPLTTEHQEWEIVSHDAERRWVETHSEPALPESVQLQLRSGAAVLISDIGSGELSMELAKKRYVAGIRSELYFPLRGPSGYQGTLHFGAPLTGDSLLAAQPWLQSLADFLSLTLRLESNSSTPDTIDESVPHELPARLQNRLELLQKLSDGLLHEMSQSLLVLFGKVELIHASTTQGGGPDQDRIESIFETVGKQSDLVAGQLRILRRICCGAEHRRHELLEGDRLLREMPDLLSGYQHRLKDSKNIHVPLVVTRWQHPNFVIDAVAVYDLLLPALLSIMDHAVCSGQLLIGVEPGERSAGLVVRFPRQLLGYTPLGSILATAFRGYEAGNAGDHTGVITCEYGRLCYHLYDEDHYELALNCDPAGSTSETTKRAIP